MLKEKGNLFGKINIAYVISLFALIFAYIGANSCCVAIFHQPENRFE